MALKFAELEWMRDQLGKYPVFLLDEVVAELDGGKPRYHLLERLDGVSTNLANNYRAWTSLTAPFSMRRSCYHVRDGQIQQLENAG